MNQRKGSHISEEMLDLKSLNDKLEQLPRDKLVYVAGAVTALAATSSKAKYKKDPAGKQGREGEGEK